MSTPPPDAVITAIETGTTYITRRVEVYESDALTPWVPDPDDPDFSRLIDGTVSVDYTRDERRTLDLTLRNDDKLLRPNHVDGLWYDKIIKVFRGVRYRTSTNPPPTVIVEATDTANAGYRFRAVLAGFGFTRTDVNYSAAALGDVADYDIVVSNTSTAATAKATLLQSAFAVGKSVLTISTANGPAQVPHIATQTAAGGAITWGIAQVTTDNPLAGTFADEAASPTATGAMPTGLAAGALRVAQWINAGGPTIITVSVATNDSGGRWLDIHLPNVQGSQAMKMLQAGLNWLRNYQTYSEWETQLGEFMIDNISEDDFPYQVKITGRDYTKKCLTSKVEHAVTFVSGTSLNTLIRALAGNAGITKFRLPVMTELLNSDISYDRGTTRWQIMKEAADAYNYEIFLDGEGYLVMRQYLDPAYGTTTSTFSTGPDGNMTTYSRSVNDSRLYNHVCVFGDPSDGEEDRLPYFGEAKNTEPTSPTRIDRIGDRLYTFASSFFTSDAQAQAKAEAFLKIHALEAYELNVGALYYPWLEAGEIVEILDPDRYDFEPTKFLCLTLDFPLSLGPMSLTAKRVTLVGDPTSDAPLEEAEQVV